TGLAQDKSKKRFDQAVRESNLPDREVPTSLPSFDRPGPLRPPPAPAPVARTVTRVGEYEFANMTNAPEAIAVTQSLVTTAPFNFKQVQRIELLKYFDATSLAVEGAWKVPVENSYAALAVSGISNKSLLTNTRTPLSAGRYLVVFRVTATGAGDP